MLPAASKEPFLHQVMVWMLQSPDTVEVVFNFEAGVWIDLSKSKHISDLYDVHHHHLEVLLVCKY